MNFRTYQMLKIKSCLNNNSLLLFLNCQNQTRGNWLKIEQGLKKLKLNYYKVYNKLAVKSFKSSIFSNFNAFISSSFFIIKLDQALLKINLNNIFIENLKTLGFTCLAVKINNKIYSFAQLKTMKSLTYNNNMAIIYQFLATHLKTLTILKNIETMWFEHMTSCSQNRRATNCAIFRDKKNDFFYH